MRRRSAPLLLLLAATTGHAASSLDFSAGLGRLTLKEHGPGHSLLVTEAGPLPRLDLTLQTQRQGWLLGLDGDVEYGEVKYSGQTQAGVPLTAVTRHWSGQATGLIGRPLGPQGRLSALLRVAGDQRDLQPTATTSGTVEVYQQLWAGVEGEQRLWEQAGHSLDLRLAWMTALAARQQVMSAGLDDFELEPGRGTGWEGALTWRITRDRRQWLLQAECRESHFSYSNAVFNTVNGAFNGFQSYQPDIRFRDCGLSLGLRRSWP